MASSLRCSSNPSCRVSYGGITFTGLSTRWSVETCGVGHPRIGRVVRTVETVSVPKEARTLRVCLGAVGTVTFRPCLMRSGSAPSPLAPRMADTASTFTRWANLRCIQVTVLSWAIRAG